MQDRYAIQQTLGTRLGRQTLLGYDHQAQQRVILKYLCFDEPVQSADIRRFQREIRVLKSLSHPAIPRYLDDFALQTAHYRGLMLVQSYIEGESLYQQIRHGRRFNEAELTQLAQQILEILCYLHQRQPALIHRDLKPSNLVLADRAHDVGQVYLVDFGLVQAAAEPAHVLMIAGTEGYRPPEQLGGRAVPASDMYCLGMTLIHLATGYHPTELPHQGLKILFAQELGDFSRPFKRWLRWLSEPRQERRPASAQEALQMLARAEEVFARRGPASVVYATLATRFRQQIQLFASLKPFGSKVQLIERDRALEVLIPSLALQWPAVYRALKLTLVGLIGLGGSSYGLVQLSLASVSALWRYGCLAGLLMASAIAVGRGLLKLLQQLKRSARIQLEPDILLVSYDTPAQPLEFVVNARKQDIYDIIFKPDASNLYLLLKRNRTRSRQLNYRLSAKALALDPDEMHWLSDLIAFWFRHSR
ncbi:MAG: serine/threonine protein kinase [Leptolyngbya sp. SIO4C1]|nr:serine/threonine protein kinase [Leptolyngbya sp. SIO4C1]